MKEKNNNKNQKFLILLLIITTINLTILLLLKQQNSNLKKYDKYTSKIVIETLSSSDSRDEYTIELNSEKDLSEVTLSFLDKPLYISKEGTMYLAGGRYKKINSNYSYANIYEILNRIDLKENNGTFHPNISKDIVNKILNNLFIDCQVANDITSNITLTDNTIENFSLHLNNINDYERISITISYKQMDDDYHIKKPIFYKEAIDLVSDESLKIIKN